MRACHTEFRNEVYMSKFIKKCLVVILAGFTFGACKDAFQAGDACCVKSNQAHQDNQIDLAMPNEDGKCESGYLLGVYGTDQCHVPIEL